KKREIMRVKSILGIKEIHFVDLPDMKLDTLPHVEVNAPITNIIDKLEPEIVYTHFYGDVTKDHRTIFESTMVATRPTGNTSVKRVLCYNTPSSTEWNVQTSGTTFMPNVYVDITDYLEDKLSAFEQYESEIRDYPHPRSIEAVKIHARYWGTH